MELQNKAAKLRATKDQLFSELKTRKEDISRMAVSTDGFLMKSVLAYVVAELALSDCERLIFEQEMKNED